MKLFNRRQQPSTTPRPAVIASAALVDHAQIKTSVRTNAWQREAWDYYDTISELRYGITWIAHALSQCELFVGETDEDTGDPEPVEDETIQQPLVELLDSQASTGDLLYRMGMQLLVVGETFLVGFDNPDQRRTTTSATPNNSSNSQGNGGTNSGSRGSRGANRRWLVCSSEEITTSTGGRINVRIPETDQQTELSGSYAMFRIWKAHPRRANQADSAVRALRPVLAELTYLSQHVEATAKSRLAGPGMLVAPESASMANPEESENINPLHSDSYISSLTRAMVTAKKDPSSAASLVPIVTRVPDDSTGKFEVLKFDSAFDERVPSLREAALRRIAAGLDLPVEILTGLGETNHWSAWRLEESAITLSVQPLLGLIADSLTKLYLRPSLQRLGISDPDRYQVGFDTSALTLRANRAPEALALYEKGLLKREVVLREHGYDDKDLPDDDEARDILARQLAVESPQLARALFPDLIKADQASDPDQTPAVGEQAEPPPLDGPPNQERMRPARTEQAPPQEQAS